MEGAEALLGPAEPVRTEMVHGSGRTQVTRMFFAGGTVIRKEPLGPDAERRLAHETAVLVRLRGVAGVARLAERLRYPGSVVLVDAGETSLAGLAEPLAPDDLIRLALRLAGAVAGMHRREVIHRDITPANIVLSADGAPCLVDFALAMSPAEIRPEVTHHGGRAHPQPGPAAGGAAAGKPAHPRRVHRRTARRGSAHRGPARRISGQRPAVRGLPPDRRRAGDAAAGSDARGPGSTARPGIRCGRGGGRRWLRPTSPS